MRGSWLIVLALVAGCSNDSGSSGSSSVRLNGGGATFIEPAVRTWADAYKKAKGHEISYQGKGSGFGIQQLIAKTIDFGCSDTPMNAEQLAKAKEAGGDVIHLPLALGAVVPAYNLPLEQPLKFTGPLLADIFLGKIKNWNDPALKALNPEAALPDKAISVITRADSSGTTAIFSEYLSKVSGEFKEKVGNSTKPNWPVGQAQNGNPGVAGFIERGEGSIGYVELFFALQNPKIKFGFVRNQAGQDVRANLDGISAAATAALATKPTAEPYTLHDLTYSLTDMPGPQAYPISGVSYAILYKKQSGAKGQALMDFLKWSITIGQPLTKDKGYAPLPAPLVLKLEAKLSEIEFTP